MTRSSPTATTSEPPRSTYAKYLSALGPGFLFAGAAIGTSHVVQSTRAGAEYGIGLLGFILQAILIKYPAFFFGPFCIMGAGVMHSQGITPADGIGEESRRGEGSRPYLILFTLMGSFRLFMDFVTVVAFLISPILATLNHFTANGASVPVEQHPSRLINAWSLLAIALVLLSLGYLYASFIH